MTDKLPDTPIAPVLSDIIESPIWSPPIDFGILPLVNVCSSPNEPVFLGPIINIAPLYELPLAF